MQHDLVEVLRDPLRFVAEKAGHLWASPRAIPNRTIEYAKYDMVRVFNQVFDKIGMNESLIEKVLARLIALPASRFLRMKRSVSLLVSDRDNAGRGTVVQGCYQSPIMVQWQKADAQQRVVDITPHAFHLRHLSVTALPSAVDIVIRRPGSRSAFQRGLAHVCACVTRIIERSKKFAVYLFNLAGLIVILQRSTTLAGLATPQVTEYELGVSLRGGPRNLRNVEHCHPPRVAFIIASFDRPDWFLERSWALMLRVAATQRRGWRSARTRVLLVSMLAFLIAGVTGSAHLALNNPSFMNDLAASQDPANQDPAPQDPAPRDPAVAQAAVEAAGDQATAESHNASHDSDSDGMPDQWETFFGLNPASNSDAGGDPDNDGLTNLQEFQKGGHPFGAFKRYFAEGSTGFFDTSFGIVNLNATEDAKVQLTFMGESGVIGTHRVTIPAGKRQTVNAATVLGNNTVLATVIESDKEDGRRSPDQMGRQRLRQPGRCRRRGAGDDVVSGRRLDRPVPVIPAAQSRAESRAGDGEVSARRRGADHQDLHRAGAEPLHRIRQSRGSRPGARVRRRRDHLDATDRRRARDVFSVNRVFDAGTGAMGVPQLATQWQFAESSTGPFFDEFVRC